MAQFGSKEEYEKWKAEKMRSAEEAASKVKKIEERVSGDPIEVVCGKCGSKNLYNPEDKREKCDRCGEWLYQFIKTKQEGEREPVKAKQETSSLTTEKTRIGKSGILSLFFCVIAACGTFIPIVMVGAETTGYKYYLWDGFEGNLIGLLFIFYGLIFASIVFSLLIIFLNKKMFQASLLIVSLILVFLPVFAKGNAQYKFLLLQARAKVATEFGPLNLEDYAASKQLFDLNYAYQEGEGFKIGLGFWLIVCSYISTTLVTGTELVRKKRKI